MKDLMNILLEGKEPHSYRLKFAFSPSTAHLEKLERMLGKYDIVSFGPVKKTIFQSKPLDFYNIDCGEVYMIDIELGRAVSQNILLYDISSLLKVSEALVHVRCATEPVQIQVQEQEDDIEFDEEYTPKLTDTDYSDADPIDKDEFMGDLLADKVVDESIAQYHEDRTPYAEYMSASFSYYYPKAQSDVAKDNGPIKE